MLLHQTLVLITFLNEHLVYGTGDSLVKLRCWKDSIYVELTNRFLKTRKLDLTQPESLHFKGAEECYASIVDNGFGLALFPPYRNCGTSTRVKIDTYTYSNEIVYETQSETIAIFSIQCNYDKKYIVSSDTPLTPMIKTLNFVTSNGKFEVSMGLYQRGDFNPKSMFGEQPSILIGTPVYAAVQVTDAFRDPNIVSTIESCFASDSNDYSLQRMYHSLIVNRCSSPDDTTVQILTNGENMISKYRFAMFQWENTVEYAFIGKWNMSVHGLGANVTYFYLHCEVRVCNKSLEHCPGVGPLCSGVSRIPNADLPARKRRQSRDIQLANSAGMLSLGPVIMKNKEVAEAGVGRYRTLYRRVAKDHRFLQVYIYVALATASVFVGAIWIVVVVTRKRKKLKTEPYLSYQE